MIEIYHAPRARSNRVIWLAEEMGLAYQARSRPRFWRTIRAPLCP